MNNPRDHRIENVPFIAQNNLNCGIQSILIVMGYWRNNPTFSFDTKLKNSENLSLKTLKQLAKSNGFNVQLSFSSPRNLADIIDSGLPVIAVIDNADSINLFTEDKKIKGHALVVFGYNDQDKKVFVHTGNSPQLTIPYSIFFEQWSSSGFASVLIWPEDFSI